MYTIGHTFAVKSMEIGDIWSPHKVENDAFWTKYHAGEATPAEISHFHALNLELEAKSIKLSLQVYEFLWIFLGYNCVCYFYFI